MRFIITVDVNTAEQLEACPQTPIAAIILHALPMILDALNIKSPEVPKEPERSGTQPAPPVTP